MKQFSWSRKGKSCLKKLTMAARQCCGFNTKLFIIDSEPQLLIKKKLTIPSKGNFTFLPTIGYQSFQE